MYAHKEVDWEFGEHGETLPFEDTKNYNEKEIKNRLTPEMVEKYCKELKIHLFDQDFYSGRGLLISTNKLVGEIAYTRYTDAIRSVADAAGFRAASPALEKP